MFDEFVSSIEKKRFSGGCRDRSLQSTTDQGPVTWKLPCKYYNNFYCFVKF